MILCQHRSVCMRPAIGQLELAGRRFAYCYDHMRLIAPRRAASLLGG